ncbi:MAG: MBL fold metallo-hydrolase [Proteobacteria bacterium]|nr:MBL fold metallo-hydrolase [Pseudomonadota bacterium]
MAEARLIRVSASTFAWIGANGDSNAGVIDTPDGLVVIDTQQLPSLARMFKNAIVATLNKPISLVINTHAHLDHVAGNTLFEPTPIIAHKKTLELLNASLGTRKGPHWVLDGFEATARLLWGNNLFDLVPPGDPNLHFFRERISAPEYDKIAVAPPTMTFTDQFDIELPNDVISLRYFGPAHCDGDITVHLKGEKTIFLGDLMFYRRFPWMGDCDLNGWIDRLTTILTFDIETVIPGHGPPTDLAEVAMFRQLFVDLRDKVETSIRSGASEDAAMNEVHLPEHASLPRYEQWRAINVRAAYRYLSGR